MNKHGLVDHTRLLEELGRKSSDQTWTASKPRKHGLSKRWASVPNASCHPVQVREISNSELHWKHPFKILKRMTQHIIGVICEATFFQEWIREFLASHIHQCKLIRGKASEGTFLCEASEGIKLSATNFSSTTHTYIPLCIDELTCTTYLLSKFYGSSSISLLPKITLAIWN